MAATDSPSPSPEDLLTQNLVGDGSAKPAAATPDKPNFDDVRTPGLPNANKPGAPAPAADAQAGGPAAPPGDAAPAPVATAAANPPGDTRAAAPTPAPGDSTIAAPVTVADASDKSGKPPHDLSNATDVMHKVDAILDGAVPTANKAHDLAAAKTAYEQAIALAKTLTPDDIAEAQKELIQVRKDKLAATDPTTKRDLANKEVDLYTITRLQDAALGNMALWYYRQGKTEDGNAKLLEAAGVDPATAQQLKKMGDPEIKAFGAMLEKSPTLSPILGDVNFFNQIKNIQATGVQVPKIFSDINQAVIQHNQEVASGAAPAAPGAAPAAPGDNTAAPAGSDKGAAAQPPAGADKGAAAQPPAYDSVKASAEMQAFIDLNKQLKDKPGPLTPDQRKVLEAGVKAYDDQNTYIGNAMDACQKALDTILPRDKQPALGAASNKASADLDKLGTKTQVSDHDGNQQTVLKLPPDLQTKVGNVLDADTPAAIQAASADLAKTQPELAKDLVALKAAAPPGADGGKAIAILQEDGKLQDAFVEASKQQVKAHYSYAKILTGTKDPADLAHAKDVFVAGFNNIPDGVADSAQKDPDMLALGKTLGLVDQTAPAAGAKPGADQTGAAPAAGADKGATGLSALTVPQLDAKLQAAIDQNTAGFTDAKALFAEEIKRAEDPAAKKIFNDQLKANVTALETGKNADGTALAAADRLALHAQDVQLIAALTKAADMHSGYALYLGDNRLALDPKHKELNQAQVQDGLNQLKSMDAEQRKAIAAADSVDVDLLKRADAQINADKKANIGDQKALNQMRVIMEGGTLTDDNGKQEKELGLMNTRVTLRDQLAALYLAQGSQFKPDHSLAAQLGGTTHTTDQLFKPQDALQLLKDAQSAYADVNGKGTTDDNTNQLFAWAQTLQPEIFKNNSEALKEKGAQPLSFVAALGGSIVGSTIVKFAAVGIADGVFHTDINPAILNTIGTASAVGSGILSHRLANRYLTGHSESWADSAIYGGSAALVPIGFKYSSEFLANNSTAQRLLAGRSSAITGDVVVQRAASSLGPDATFSQVAEQFRSSGLVNEAKALDQLNLGGQTVASATADEMAAVSKGLNLSGGRGTEALTKLFPTMDRSVADAKVVTALNRDGVSTVGQLQDRLNASATRVTDLSSQLDPSLKGGASVREALKKMTVTTAEGVKPRFIGQALDDQVSFLADNNIKTVKQLADFGKKAGAYFTVDNLYPEIAATAKGDMTMPLSEAATGSGFGAAGSAGRTVLRNMLPDPGLVVDAKPSGWAASIGRKIDGAPRWVANKAYNDRLYKAQFDDGPAISFPNLGKPTATGIRGLVSRVTPDFTAPDMPNIQKIDGLTAPVKQVGIASTQTKFYSAAIASGIAMGQYNVTTDLYGDWYKGAQYQDSNGEWHNYSFMGALGQAGKATAGEALIGGFFLKGALPAVLDEPVAARAPGFLATKVAPAIESRPSWLINKLEAPPGWLGQKIPALQSASETTAGWLRPALPAAQKGATFVAKGLTGLDGSLGAGSTAVAGSGNTLYSFGKYALIGNTGPYQGYMDLKQARDNQNTYDSTQKPLTDPAIDDVGTTADGLAGQPPASDSTPQPAAADAAPAVKPPDGGTAPAANPNADVPTTPAKAKDGVAPAPAAPAPAPAPAKAAAAPPPAANQSTVGADQKPPGT